MGTPDTDGAQSDAGADQALSARIRKAMLVLRGTPRVLKLLWEASPASTFGVIALNCLLGLIPLGQIALGKMIVDTVAVAASTGMAHDDSFSSAIQQLMPQLIPILVLMAVLNFLNHLLDPSVRLLNQNLGALLTRKVTVMIMEKANSLADISFFDDPKFYDKLEKARQESGHRPISMLFNLALILRSSMGLGSMLLVLLLYNPWLAIVVTALAIPHLIVQFQHQEESWKLNDWEVPEVRRMHYFSRIATDRDTAKEVRLLGLGDYFIGEYEKKFKDFHDRHATLRLKQWTRNVSLGSISAIGYIGACAYIVFEAAVSRITLGSMTLYTGAVSQIEGGLLSMVWGLAGLYESNLFLNHLFEFLDVQPAIATSPAGGGRRAPERINEGIELRNVGFRYPDSDKAVLEDVSFKILPGQTVALVGENGAGKTTLVKLLTRLYDPSTGTVLVDGVDIKELDLEDWRRRVAVAFQDFGRYHQSARENIGIGDIDRLAMLDVIEAAADRSGARAVVDKLDHGFETLLGAWFSNSDRGADISGGEWQKLALARTFMRVPPEDKDRDNADGNSNSDDSDSPRHTALLILDEPTAALDVQSEAALYSRFHELSRGRTALLISHRFSTVRMADIILVLENGKILEQGSHEELIALGGRYAELYNMQAERYR